jgi:1A family penicillin-binding protein
VAQTIKLYDTSISKLVERSLQTLQRFLEYAGKPLFKPLTYFAVALLVIFQTIKVKGLSPETMLFLSKKVFSLSKKLYIRKIKEAKLNLSGVAGKLTSLKNTISESKKYAEGVFSRFKENISSYRPESFRKVYTRILYPLAAPAVIVAFFSFGIWGFILKDLPSPGQLTKRKVDVSTKIYDRNGILLYKIYKDHNRTPVKLEDIPKHVQLATLAIEDAEFYYHTGFSVRGMMRAALDNLRKKRLSGGSTITQQLVKNTLLTPEKTIRRKLREITLAVLVEIKYSKDEILQMYLNEVSYGGTAYGIQEAARVYFGKDVDRLTLGEAALLAGLPKSPTEYSPFGLNPELALARQKEVLKLMRINGYINQDQYKTAMEERIRFVRNKTDIKAPHFVMFVRESLEEKYGKQVVQTGGLKVITTLDYKIQKLAEEAVKSEVENLKNLNVTNGANVVLNPKTGEILAMVGSKDYFDTQNDGNVNVVTRLRQPGSSIKIVNYAYALENSYTPATILKDTPVRYVSRGQPPYSPKNYDGKYVGFLSLREAFAQSRNVPAVKVLASYGVENMVKMGQEMGIASWSDPGNYGLSLTLGGGDVKLLDLARVYSTVANYGTRVPLKSVISIENYKGKILENNECIFTEEVDDNYKIAQNSKRALDNFFDTFSKDVLASSHTNASCASKQVLDPRVAFMLTDILKDNNARSPAFGHNSLLNIPNHKEVAVKTGTSNDLRDNLAVGYNQDYVVGVWVGNNDNSPMSRVASGITGATPIFNKIMTALLSKKENHDWVIPEGLKRVRVCKLTGTLSCSGCPMRFEWFLEENTPTKHCSSQTIAEINKKTQEKP